MQRFDDARLPASLACWTLTDGRAGNVRQAQALADALHPAPRDWTLQARAPWRWWAPRAAPGSVHAFGDAFRRALTDAPALAIGCGRQAALATRELRARGTFAVQILDPRLDPALWDLVITPQHDGLQGANVVTLAGSLHPVDDAWLAQARVAFASLAADETPQLALLVGGSNAHGRFDAGTFAPVLKCVRHWASRTHGRILATASRRTPDDVRDALRALPVPHLAWTRDADGANPYSGLLAFADVIVCTADSVNMLSEACATHAPVYVAGIDTLQGRPRRFVDHLLQMGRVRALDDALAPFDVTPLRETARVAAEVRARFDARR
ncbi:mitochondrial fission ELM1 family protein [Cognatilysobacter bugurensis]|uniref:Nucleoside-diphosphate sugar epimerase n=1 Tax=Cognatilysobacter bugurensis TaxID=543356 RepID=A0A918SZP8_9GAMM|nr:mitochondrial fission ELM1 family protein [Lysobacter bugurensis]GHA80974.1 nucleoside-diphosphate sugar epimerase [Lysobacter bugurensis]